jgi:putative peptidoglycan lipid II flippase
MLRWTFPYLFFISLSALFSGVLNSYNKFALPAYTQVIMNIVMMHRTVSDRAEASNPGMALAMGVFASGLLQLGFQLPAVIKLGCSAGRAGDRAAEACAHRQLMLPASSARPSRR